MDEVRHETCKSFTVEQSRMCSSGKGDAMPRTKGFSLIELLIVVAIILIIAAIAVPNFLRSRLIANESAAAAGVRTVNTAQISYYSSYPTVGYASALSSSGWHLHGDDGADHGERMPARFGAGWGRKERVQLRHQQYQRYAERDLQCYRRAGRSELNGSPLFLLLRRRGDTRQRVGDHDLR